MADVSVQPYGGPLVIKTRKRNAQQSAEEEAPASQTPPQTE
jgi:hypothetical protein